METAVVRLSMPGGVGGQRREPLPTRLTPGAIRGRLPLTFYNSEGAEYISFWKNFSSGDIIL